MSRRLAPAFLLPLVFTAAALGGAAWNRSSARGPIVLTERELQLRLGSGNNSATRAGIMWHQTTGQPWATRETLVSLGFDVSVDPTSQDAPRHYRRMLPKRLWVAFELGGPLFESLPAETRAMQSRLVPIDADRDARALAARYPDGTRYLVTAAVVRAIWVKPPGKPPYVTANIDSITPRDLHVPRAIAPVVGGGRFRVSVLYGRRLEPWIAGASR